VNPYQQMVEDWHVAMGEPVGDYAAPAVTDRKDLRAGLIEEEGKELADALKEGTSAERSRRHATSCTSASEQL
jgi:hypothetical protein